MKAAATFLLLSLLIFNVAKAQMVDPRDAKKYFKMTNFIGAMGEYHKLLKLDRDNVEYNTNLGICYLRTNIEKTKALPYLARAYKNPKHGTETKFYYGWALLLNMKYAKAKTIFQEYLVSPGKYKIEAENFLKSCESGPALRDNPVNVSFKNMGKFINTRYPDYNPFVTKNEKRILFTSRRDAGKGQLEFDGYYGSDIYEVSYNGSTFSKAKNIGSVNTALDEEVIGLTDSGDTMYVYLDHNLGGKDDAVGDIYFSVRSGSKYAKRIKLDIPEVNTSDMEISCSVSSDGKTMLFSSNRTTGKGGYDIFMLRMLPFGKWSLAQNISSINSAGDEKYPTLAPDGKTMYFTSNGLPGMGGYDLFKAIWNPETNEWGKPINLGYPLNTPDDENTICFPADKKHGYISATRKDGFGDLDIYRVTFNDILLNPALFIVNLQDETTSTTIKGASIFVLDEDETEIAEFNPNKNSGVFTMTLDPGKYTVEIEAPGYPLISKSFNVSEFDYKQGAILKNIQLIKD